MENNDKHPLIGKIVSVSHGPDTMLAYQPVRVLDVAWPLIQFGPILEGKYKSKPSNGYPYADQMPSFWMPIADCKIICDLEDNNPATG